VTDRIILRARGLTVASVVSAVGLLIVVLVAAKSVAPTSTATSTAPETTAAADASAPVLGARLGSISFETRASDVLRILGEPQSRTLAHGLGTPVWNYANGLVVGVRYGRGSQRADEVWQLWASPPFPGVTAEGFRLGDSQADFARLYRNYAIRSFSQPTQSVISDATHRNLTVMFGPDGRAIALYLTDRCTTCDPGPSGTPGLKKSP
jgi:hypothetical protein